MKTSSSIFSKKKRLKMILCKPLEKRTIFLIMLFFGYGQFYILRNVVRMALHVYGFMNIITSDTMEEKAIVQFYYGFCFLQIPFARLSERFGGKTLMGFGILGASILSLIIPYAFQIGGYNALGFINGFIGACLAAYNSSVFSLASKWITVEERGKLVCTYSSLYLGNAFIVMTLQLEHFSSKEILFIIPGLSGIIWTVCWYMLVYDSPLTHPTITRQERKHIIFTKESEGTIYDRAIDCPWSEICFDPHVWVVFTTHTCFWTGAVFLNQRSLVYLQETFELSPLENPFWFLLPFFLSFFSAFLSGLLFDFLHRLRISLILLQKIYTNIATIVPAIAFVGFLCQNSMSWTLFFYILGLAFATWMIGGQYTIFLDLAPNFAATLHAMSGTVAAFGYLLITEVMHSLDAGLEKHEQWEKRHSLVSALFFTAGTMFTLFGNNNLADWNTPIVFEDV